MNHFFIASIMRFNNYGQIRGLNNHCERKRKYYEVNPDIRTEDSDKNYHLVLPDDTYEAFIKKRIQEVQPKCIRRNSILMVSLVVTTSHEWMIQQSPERQKLLFEDTLSYIEGLVGKENICSAVIHMDETTPHMHLQLIPLTRDGRLNMNDALQLVYNEEYYRGFLDRIYTAISKDFPELERGEKKELTRARKVSIPLLKRMDSYYRQYYDIAKNIQSIAESPSPPEAANHVLDRLNAIIPQYANLKKDIEKLSQIQDQHLDEIQLWKDQYQDISQKYNHLLDTSIHLKQALTQDQDMQKLLVQKTQIAYGIDIRPLLKEIQLTVHQGKDKPNHEIER